MHMSDSVLGWEWYLSNEKFLRTERYKITVLANNYIESSERLRKVLNGIKGTEDIKANTFKKIIIKGE